MGHRLFALLFASTLLVACGGDKAGTGSGEPGDNGLPKPGAVNGSVTGMPNPGTASARPSISRAPDIVESPNEAGAGELASVEDPLQPMTDDAQPALIPDQPDPELAIDIPTDDPTPAAPAGEVDPSPPRQ